MTTMKSRRAAMALLALMVVSATVAGQAAGAADEAQGRFALGGEELSQPVAVLDPFGTLVVRGRDAAGAQRELSLSFPELVLPAAGDHAVGDAADGLRMQLDSVWRTGQLTVERFAVERVVARGTLRDPELSIVLDLPAPEVVPVVTGSKPGVVEPAPVDTPDAADLVFCAMGNTGTGSAVQRQIGATIAELAPTGPMNFALLLGDLIVPGGVREMTDPRFRTCFEEPYPDHLLPMLFYGVLGDRDHTSMLTAISDYASASPRLDMPHLAYKFTVSCGDKEVLFVGMDTSRYVQGVRDPSMRFVNRVVSTALRDSKAPIKIVIGHDSIYGSGPDGRDGAMSRALTNYLGRTFEDTDVDLYLSASAHQLEVAQGDHGMVEVVSGTGGGLARSVTASDRSLFASTEPGFAWVRYDGETMEVSLRSATGAVLHVHRWQPD